MGARPFGARLNIEPDKQGGRAQISQASLARNRCGSSLVLRSAARAALDLQGAANVVANTSALKNPFKFEPPPVKSAMKSSQKIEITH